MLYITEPSFDGKDENNDEEDEAFKDAEILSELNQMINELKQTYAK